jgi:hypothetical protein
MKKIITFIIVLSLVFFVSSCKGEPAVDDDFQIMITAQFSNGIEGGLVILEQSDNIDWKTQLGVLDFKAYLRENYQATGLFELITTQDGKTMKNAIGDLKNTGYISIPIHIRSIHPDVIQIDQIGINGFHKNHKLEVGFHDPLGNFIIQRTPFRVNIADAVRISLIGMIGQEEHILVYENPASSTNVVLGGHELADFSKNLLGAHDYHFRKIGTMLPGIHEVTVPNTITEISNDVIFMFDPTTEPSVDGYYYAVVYLNVWIELWDYNSFTFVVNDYLTVSFTIKAFVEEAINDDSEIEDIIE